MSDTTADRPATWAERFVEYDRKHPDIYVQFKKYTYQVISTGRRCGAHDIMCRIRWETLVSGDGRYKINQNFAAYYGRKFMRDHVDHAAFFNTRELRS